MSDQSHRFFARIISLDLACPDCGRVTATQKHTVQTGHWMPEIGRFQCWQCGAVYRLGVLAFQVATEKNASTQWKTSDDIAPNAKEAIALRHEPVDYGQRMDKVLKFYYDQDKNAVRRVNKVAKELCTCTASVVDVQKCKVHGDGDK